MAKGDPSYLGRVMTTGMSRLQYGIEDAREAAFNMVESIAPAKISWSPISRSSVRSGLCSVWSARSGA